MPSSLRKGLFIFSVALLAYLGGFATRWHDWFPNAHLERTSQQTTALFTMWSAGPPNLHDKVYDRLGAQTVRPNRVQPGLTLITSSWSTDEGWTAGLNLIDESGTAVHRWRFDRRRLFPDSVDRRGNPALKALHGTYLFPNGDVLGERRVRRDGPSRCVWPRQVAIVGRILPRDFADGGGLVLDSRHESHASHRQRALSRRIFRHRRTRLARPAPARHRKGHSDQEIECARPPLRE
jgi:hypothetical protein